MSGRISFLAEKKETPMRKKIKEKKCYVSLQQMQDGDKQIKAVVIKRQKYSSKVFDTMLNIDVIIIIIFFFFIKKISSVFSLHNIKRSKELHNHL